MCPCCRAVSYTHLDVYKRQTGETVNLASRLTPDDELEVQISTPVASSVVADTNIHNIIIKMEGQGDKKMTVRDGKFLCASVFST